MLERDGSEVEGVCGVKSNQEPHCGKEPCFLLSLLPSNSKFLCPLTSCILQTIFQPSLSLWPCYVCPPPLPCSSLDLWLISLCLPRHLHGSPSAWHILALMHPMGSLELWVPRVSVQLLTIIFQLSRQLFSLNPNPTCKRALKSQWLLSESPTSGETASWPV